MKKPVCFDCKKEIDGDPVSWTPKTVARLYHKECHEMLIWRMTSPHAKAKRYGKAGNACNGRVIRSSRGLSWPSSFSSPSPL